MQECIKSGKMSIRVIFSLIHFFSVFLLLHFGHKRLIELFKDSPLSEVAYRYYLLIPSFITQVQSTELKCNSLT